MKFKISKELLGSLPEPDPQGTVRVSASIRVNGEEGEIVEINDHPVSAKDADDDEGSPSMELPDIDAAVDSFSREDY